MISKLRFRTRCRLDWWRYEVTKYSERAIMWVVWKLPKVIIMWAAIRLHANATYVYKDKTPGEISIFEALDAWGKADEDH